MFVPTFCFVVVNLLVFEKAGLQGVEPSPPPQPGAQGHMWLVIYATLTLPGLTPPWCKDQQHLQSAKPLYSFTEEHPQMAGHKYGRSSYTVEGI